MTSVKLDATIKLKIKTGSSGLDPTLSGEGSIPDWGMEFSPLISNNVGTDFWTRSWGFSPGLRFASPALR